jgi:cytoskeletal protein CcmA (bactofilin family)
LVGIGGVTEAGQQLTVTGNTKMNGDLAVTGVITGDIEMSGNLQVDGSSVIGSDTIDTTRINAIVGIGGAAEGGLHLKVYGNTRMVGLLVVDGATTLSSTLGVTGATTLSSTLQVNGSTTLGNGTADDTVTMNANVGMGGAPESGKRLTVTGDTKMTGGLAVSGATTMSNTLGVTGATTLSGLVGIGGDPVAGTQLTVTGNLKVTGNTNLGNEDDSAVGTDTTTILGILAFPSVSYINGARINLVSKTTNFTLDSVNVENGCTCDHTSGMLTITMPPTGNGGVYWNRRNYIVKVRNEAVRLRQNTSQVPNGDPQTKIDEFTGDLSYTNNPYKTINLVFAPNFNETGQIWIINDR